MVTSMVILVVHAIYVLWFCLPNTSVPSISSGYNCPCEAKRGGPLPVVYTHRPAATARSGIPGEFLPSHPVRRGLACRAQMGILPASLVATIRNGRLDPLRGPAQVASAVGVIDFRLFVAISDHSLPARELRDVENAYFGI